MFNGTLTASDGYNSAVNLRCSGAVPLTCTPSPAVLVPSTAGAAFTVTASNDAQNHFNFTIDATGTDTAHIHKSTPVELIVGFNFVINNNSAAQTIKAGQTASYNLDAVPLGNGSVFPGQRNSVVLDCQPAAVDHMLIHAQPGRFGTRRHERGAEAPDHRGHFRSLEAGRATCAVV